LFLPFFPSVYRSNRKEALAINSQGRFFIIIRKISAIIPNERVKDIKPVPDLFPIPLDMTHKSLSPLGFLQHHWLLYLPVLPGSTDQTPTGIRLPSKNRFFRSIFDNVGKYNVWP
jgi:hypothetical protein